MAQEIERKFLVRGAFKPFAREAQRIAQGYLSTEAGRSVRVRIKGEVGYLTIKGASDPTGVSRFEWEKTIDLADAQDLMKLCLPGIIDKTRYLIPCGEYTFEVDEFHGDNEGLIIAEIELPHPDAPFEHPDWLGEEVTGDPRYYNSSLVRLPFKLRRR